ncbi:cholera enterotoxin subunit A2, partial [Colletotrichum graminicola M1.001]
MAYLQKLLLFFYLASFWFSSGECAPFRRTGPKFVYRGAGRSPQEIKAAGGFLPKGLTTVGVVAPDISLFSHVDVPQEVDENGNSIGLGSTADNDGYVSLTKSFFLALGHAFYSRDQKTTYVYKIKSTPNMIDVAKTLREYNLYEEEDEFSALGGVKWDQIVAWYKVDGHSLRTYSWLWQIKNPDYNARKYSGFRPGGAQYGLAGFPADHEAWNKEPWSKFKPCSGETST